MPQFHPGGRDNFPDSFGSVFCNARAMATLPTIAEIRVSARRRTTCFGVPSGKAFSMSATSVPILTKDSKGLDIVRISGNEEDACLHLAVSCGSGDAGRLGFWAEHAAEAGLAESDRVAVG
jgi:hypothetical protein